MFPLLARHWLFMLYLNLFPIHAIYVFDIMSIKFVVLDYPGRMKNMKYIISKVCLTLLACWPSLVPIAPNGRQS